MTTKQTEVKHTAGPWHVEKPYNEPGIYIGSESTALVAKIYEHLNVSNEQHQIEANEKESEANARLIAAAPELLEACKFALESGDDLAAIEKIKAAIARAEGKTNE